MIYDKEERKRRISSWIEKNKIQAVIFDLDGTLIDNNAYHLKTWEKYLSNLGRKISKDEYNVHINGRTNRDAIEYIYGRKMSEEELLKHTLEKEALYREIYKPFIKPVSGLLDFLDFLKSKNIPVAIATSGIQPNIDFMFEHIPIENYFSVIVNSAHIKKGKPDPEIYLKTASILKISPENCMVFEDAIVGIQSAKAAGMKVIALSTTHPKNELEDADRVITDYEEI